MNAPRKADLPPPSHAPGPRSGPEGTCENRPAFQRRFQVGITSSPEQGRLRLGPTGIFPARAQPSSRETIVSQTGHASKHQAGLFGPAKLPCRRRIRAPPPFGMRIRLHMLPGQASERFRSRRCTNHRDEEYLPQFAYAFPSGFMPKGPRISANFAAVSFWLCPIFSSNDE